MAENFADLDVTIIGGGPAGLSAALWCSELGLKASLFESESEFGGQLLWTFNAIKNYLGMDAANGRELRDRFLQHIENINVTRVTGATVVSSDLAKKTIDLADGSRHSGRVIIIATGVRRRKLGVPGEKDFCGSGLLASGARSKDEVAGKTVLIVGGADAALENALILSDTAGKVIVAHRRSDLTARKEFVQRANNRSNIEFLVNVQVAAIVGNTVVEAVQLQNTITGERSNIAADAVLIRIGVEPNTEMFRGQISLDTASYISIDARCATSLEGVYAVGDVANPVSPTISSAAGMGAIAAKAIFNRRKN